MYELIKAEIEKIRKKYLESAEEIVSGYNRECSLSKDYEGRQMFELLQNADDEATGSTGKVLITFDGKTLSVSNTGEPFSFRGVKSLLYPNASPKVINENKIGCKGLGFRSILTWSDSVTVATEAFTIQFSKEYAIGFLSSILAENPGLKSEISELSKEEYPIATLTCPHLQDKSALVDGYDTSIIMECHPELSQEIERQIKSLEFEELVFLPNLREIEIICNGYHKVFQKVVEDNDVIISTDDKTTGESELADWKLYRQTGVIQDEKNCDKNYEFIIAFDPSGEHQGEVLYSYFKTDVKLGFPALIHGTFELTSDRNSLQKQSIVNRQLIELLADFMVETAVKISQEQSVCDYKPLSMIITPDLDIVLKNIYNLDELLRKKAHEKRILPTIGNAYISVNDLPRYSSGGFATVLNPMVFSTLLKKADDSYIEDYITRDLGIRFYEYEDFCRLLNSDRESYTLEKKVQLIALIDSKYPYNRSSEFPHLIIDNNGESISDSATIYPFPSEEQVIALPAWVDIKFLSQDMERYLYSEFGFGNNKRALVNKLSRYHVEEYSFDRLLRSVVSQIDDEAITADKCSDILNWLWDYYDREDRQTLPDVKVKVICRDGGIRNAKECYIGSEYGNDLGERLVGIFSENFVAFDGLNIKCDDVAAVASFLEWIGASKFPRLVKKSLSYNERQEYLDICYPLYVQRDNCRYPKTEFYNINTVSVGTFEHLDELLENADFNDLLSWFVLDSEIGSRLQSDTEESNSFSCVKGYPYKKSDERTVLPEYMKSYLRFVIANKKWIPNINGTKEKPEYCCFEENSLEPFIIVPNIDYSRIKSIVGRNCKKEVDAILSRIGVSDVFQEMNSRVIYQALLKLPELDPECKKARALYRKIIRDGLSPDEYKANNPDFVTFIQTGKVAAKKDGVKRYYPISEVKYADKKVFSDEILKSFCMFDIDARSGEEKVKRLFGVEPLKYANVEIVGTPSYHPLDEAFKKEYQRFLPFVYACRMELKQSDSDFRRLKSSKVILCSKLRIQYKFGEETKISNLKDYERVYLRKDNTAYICVPSKFSLFSDLKQIFEFADSVAELITAILDVNDDKDFFRDLFRDSDLVREKKMRSDKNDDNLELLHEARRRFDTEVNPRDEFWMTIAEVLQIPNVEISAYSADELLSVMKLPFDIDEGIQYGDLSCNENIEKFIVLFGQLGIDIDKYNVAAVHSIDTTKYWLTKLRSKMMRYLKQYQAYIINDLQDENDCIKLYSQYLEEYRYLEPTIRNSLFVNIDDIFERECGVSFDDLDDYSESTIDELIKTEKSKLSETDLLRLPTLGSPQIVEAYLIFGRISELLNPVDETQEANHLESQPAVDDGLEQLVHSVFSMQTDGFTDVSMQAVEDSHSNGDEARPHKPIKRVHSELSDKKKQEIGMVGEAFVYKTLLEMDPGALWVSGNAEKAGQIPRGDDTCGYDIKYTDANGNIQYVEVKASRSEEISFCISDNELRFGCKNASCYEIIYVVIGEDGLPAHKPWRLGHLFEFEDGEELFNNERFSVESDSYRVVAKRIEKPQE